MVGESRWMRRERMKVYHCAGVGGVIVPSLTESKWSGRWCVLQKIELVPRTTVLDDVSNRRF
jgi:hypothetical protein